MQFKICAHTDTGIRKRTNQDSVLIQTARTDKGLALLAAVCDGMGGLARGELASATVVRRLSAWFEQGFSALFLGKMTELAFQESMFLFVRQVNEDIRAYSRSHHAEMGTTMAVLLIADHSYYIANIGDSRIYLLGDRLRQLTRDQTWVQREVEEGRLTDEAALRHPRRNVLTQCIGASSQVCPEYACGRAKPGSMFLLCSDGFRHELSPLELYAYLNPQRLTQEQEMKEGLLRLTELNKYRGEIDNISAALIRVDE